MTFLSGGQLSTDKLIVQFVYIFTVSFLFGLELEWITAQSGDWIELIPAQTGMIKSNIQSTMMDWDYAITDDVIKYVVTNNSIWIVVTNDVII